MRSYEELVKRVPMVKKLIEQGDTDAVEQFYRNVCHTILYYTIFLSSNCSSVSKGLWWRTGRRCKSPQIGCRWVDQRALWSLGTTSSCTKQDRKGFHQWPHRPFAMSCGVFLGLRKVSSTIFIHCCGSIIKTRFSVRANIRNGHDDYVVTVLLWPKFLYADYKCDPDDVEKGLFKSPLLVKVCQPQHMQNHMY